MKELKNIYPSFVAIRAPDDCQELQEEIQDLERQLKQKHYELFQVQRNKYKSKSARVNTLPKKPEVFVRPQVCLFYSSAGFINFGYIYNV